MGDGAGQEARSQAGQILWLFDVQVQDAPGNFINSIEKFTLYLTK